MAKKYFSVFNNGIEDFHVKDADAVAMMESVINSMVINEQTGDVTISYDDGTEEEES